MINYDDLEAFIDLANSRFIKLARAVKRYDRCYFSGIGDRKVQFEGIEYFNGCGDEEHNYSYPWEYFTCNEKEFSHYLAIEVEICEAKSREKEELKKLQEEQRKKDSEKYELQTLARLKAKYEGPAAGQEVLGLND